jgi:hypothetical protein
MFYTFAKRYEKKVKVINPSDQIIMNRLYFMLFKIIIIKLLIEKCFATLAKDNIIQSFY